jgi:hypothetical protein
MSRLATAVRRVMAAPKARVGIATFVFGVAVLARTQAYYGDLLRGWDAQYYYSTAHSIVFDRDFDITDDLQATPFSSPFDRDADGLFEAAPRDPHGRIVSDYPIGLPLIEAPFLALGHGARRGLAALTVASSRPPGYGAVEIWAVALGLLALVAIGLQLLHDIVRAHVPSPWCEVAVVVAWWGTSLLYYSAVFPFMTHAAAFTLVVWSVWIAWRVGSGLRSPRLLWLLGLAVGALYLVRQQQIVVAVPLLLVLAPLLQRPARLWIGWAAAGIATLLVLIAAQSWAHARLGSQWSFDALRLATFDWLHPDLATVLVSPARGLVWLSPIVLLAAAGFVRTPRLDMPRPFAALALHAIMQIYLIAASPFADQGDAFGMRMWAECAGAVACGVGLLYVHRSYGARLLISVAAGACLLWTNRLLVLYVTGRLHLGMSYAECVRLVFGT